MNKQQTIVIPLLLAIILMTGIAGCKNAKTPASSEQSSTESTASPSVNKNADGKKARSPEAKKRREEIRNQIKAVLTPEQVKQLESKMQTGEKMRQVLNNLNLTADQNTKIEAIYKTARANRQSESPAK